MCNGPERTIGLSCLAEDGSVQVVAIGMQRPRRNGTPLTEVYGTDGRLIIREVNDLRLGATSSFAALLPWYNMLLDSDLLALELIKPCTGRWAAGYKRQDSASGRDIVCCASRRRSCAT